MVKRTSLADADCPIARALDVIGDWWSLLIVRDALLGRRRFGEFQKSLGLAKNILTTRLRTLVDRGLLELAPASDGWPRLIVFNTCPQLLRALPAAPRSPHNAEDIDPAFSLDHAIDSVTYALSARDRTFRRVPLRGV